MFVYTGSQGEEGKVHPKPFGVGEQYLSFTLSLSLLLLLLLLLLLWLLLFLLRPFFAMQHYHRCIVVVVVLAAVLAVVIIIKPGVGPAYIGGRDTDKEGTQVEICKYLVMSPKDLKIYCYTVSKNLQQLHLHKS